MKRLLVLAILLTFTLSTFSMAQDAKKKSLPTKPAKEAKVDKAKSKDKWIKGTVVSFNDLVIGGKGIVTVEKATDLVGKGQPIVMMGADKKVYFVYNTDGSFAGPKLAKLAAAKQIGIVGKKKTLGGVNVLIADKIEAM